MNNKKKKVVEERYPTTIYSSNIQDIVYMPVYI